MDNSFLMTVYYLLHLANEFGYLHSNEKALANKALDATH